MELSFFFRCNLCQLYEYFLGTFYPSNYGIVVCFFFKSLVLFTTRKIVFGTKLSMKSSSLINKKKRYHLAIEEIQIVSKGYLFARKLIYKKLIFHHHEVSIWQWDESEVLQSPHAFHCSFPLLHVGPNPGPTK